MVIDSLPLCGGSLLIPGIMVEHVHIHIVCIGTIFDNESVVSDDIE
ncbi:hypothetical protein [Enterocloster citroniae]|nr:hypothetical protein [Enterocloster citroniae]